jgi:hypothetical protein
MALKIYDPDQVSFILGNINIADGWADGEAIRYEHNTPAFTKVVGTRGQVARSKSLDKSGTFTITLLQTADENDLLSLLLNTDRNAPNGAGVVPLTLLDRQGRLEITAQEAWISDPPKPVFSRGAEAREWKIDVADATRFDGGN